MTLTPRLLALSAAAVITAASVAPATTPGSSGPASTFDIEPATQAPPVSTPGSFVYLVPTSARAAGYSGTTWRTDLELHNPGSTETDVSLYFLKGNTDNTGAVGVPVKLPGGQSVRLGDVVGTLFGESSASGAILIGSTSALVVASRTFNDAATGTFGELMEGYSPAQASHYGEKVHLIGLTQDETYRTNFGIANAGPTAVTVTATFYRFDGTLLGTRGYTLAPFGWRQETKVIEQLTAEPVADAYAVVSSGSSGSSYYVYASVIDNRTGDPVHVVPARKIAPEQASGPTSLGPVDPSGLDAPATLIGDVRAVAVVPTRPGTIYSALYGRGVFRSNDSGRSWVAASNGLSDLTMRALAVDPARPDTLYAGTATSGVFKSSDGGSSWFPASTGLEGQGVLTLAIDPTRPETLFASTESAGILKSTDGGALWRPVNRGMESLPPVQALAIDSSNGETIFAGTGGAGIFKSNDGGASWTPANVGLTNLDVRALAIDPAMPQNVYAGTFAHGGGVFRSSDGGASWASASSGLSGSGRYVQALTVVPGKPGTVVVASYGGGVFRSSDRGSTWQAWNDGLDGPFVRALAVSTAGTPTLYAATHGPGVFMSPLADAAWTPINTGLSGLQLNVWALAADPGDPQTIYSATYGGGALKTTDGGATWTPINQGLPTAQVTRLALVPGSPQTVLAATWGSGVQKSSNGGTSWTAVNSGLTTLTVNTLAIVPSSPQTMFAGTWGGGVFRSTDGGNSWTASNTGLTAAGLFVRVLVADPTSPQTLYAGTDAAGVFKSTDGGANWAAANTGLTVTRVQALVIDPEHPQKLYAGTTGGVFASTDGGANWADASTGLTSHFVQALLVDPLVPGTLFAGTATGGIFQSTDSGVTWTDANAGLTGSALNVRVLTMTPSTLQVVLAGTGGSGVLRRAFGSCAYTVSPTAQTFDFTGGAATLAVTAAVGCSWTASTQATWITFTSATGGSGNGSVSFAVAASTSDVARVGTITIGGQVVTVTQGPTGCPTPAAPTVTGPAQAASGTSYSLTWSATSPAGTYELQEATEATFASPTTSAVTGEASSFSHTVTSSAIYYYRVRAVHTCGALTLRSSWSVPTSTAVLPAGVTLFVPATAHSEGAAGTVWRTDLEVANPGATAVVFTLGLLARDQANPNPQTATFSLPPQQSVRFHDVLHSPTVGFGVTSGAATLSVKPAGGPVLVTARTYNDQPTGTYGQLIAGQPQDQAISAGQEARVVMLSHSATPGVGFRTNLGMVNATSQTILVEVKLFSGTGALLGTLPYQLRAFEYKQADQILGLVTPNDVPVGFAVLRTPTTGGAFFAYASVIDNRSGDPIYVPARVVE